MNNQAVFSARSNRRRQLGFTLIELLVVIAIIAILAGMLLPALSKAKDRTQAIIDVNNIRQIVISTVSFATDNNEILPHPTWGDVPAGPNGWAYATKVAGLGTIPTAANQLTASNQVPFFKESQLGNYLGKQQKVLDCPKDVVERTGDKKKDWLARPVKLTSYTFSGALCGYAGKEVANAAAGNTYKLTSFQPMDIFVWEADETRSYNFNDAGNNILSDQEGVSQRHAGGKPTDPTRNVKGGAVVGRLGGTSHFIKWAKFKEFRDTYNRTKARNDLVCGPGF